MKSLLIALLAVAPALALSNATKRSCSGSCVDINSYSCSSGFVTGLCPGATNIKCCTGTVACGGTCASTSAYSCSTSVLSGVCPGGSLIKCCTGTSTASGHAYGIDVSTALSTTSASCMVSAGYTFGVTRCFRSSGTVDPNCADNVAHMWSGGFSHVDVYMFPCPLCSASATTQVNTLKSYLQTNSVMYGKVWLDIEGSSYWSSSYTTNQAWFAEMLSAAVSAFGSKKVGIYCNKNGWTSIMGTTYTGGSAYPLWWPKYDSTASLTTGWASFGGWSAPLIKQYDDTQTVCSTGVDLNYY